MTSITNLNTLLKTLPILAVITASLVLSPTLSLADNNDRGHAKEKYSHNADKHHNKGKAHSNNYRDKKHGNRKNHTHRSERHHRKGHAHYNKHASYKHGHNKHRHDHSGHYNGHTHTNYIVNNGYHSHDHYGLEQLRFMIGLHTDNFDIILRD